MSKDDRQICVEGKDELLSKIDAWIEDEGMANKDYGAFSKELEKFFPTSKIAVILPERMFKHMSRDEGGHRKGLVKLREVVEELPEC